MKILPYLDDRRNRKCGIYPIKLCATAHGSRSYVAIGLSVPSDAWDSENRRVKDGFPNAKKFNHLISSRRLEAEGLSLMTPDITPSELCARLSETWHPEKAKPVPEKKRKDTLGYAYAQHMSLKKGKTLQSYSDTLNRLRAFCNVDDVALDDINKAWLTKWDSFLSLTAPSPNSRAVYMRNLRAVFNNAIDEGWTDNYPFRKFRIKTVATAKRSLSVEELRLLWDYPVDPVQKKYLDFFKLSFLLIGINSVDLLKLPSDAVNNGRISYNRSKTKRLYIINVEPEAMEIIDAYRGESHLLEFLDRYANYEDFRKRVNKGLKSIGPLEILKHGKKVRKPLFPELTTYWARHTWATIAASLDIPKETIAHALGHGSTSVTDIYIDFDQKKVDDANRRVIDHVLGLSDCD